ncbi:MAG TPA: hypothetical protein VGZ47_06820 [Gemmataceae bacterium]|jgi:hypothetical protein|nr:hypothetical protein [Gemmataceae bacterium]
MRVLSFFCLLPLLLAAEPPKPEASRVSLDPSAKTVTDAAASISKQANFPIDVSRAVQDNPLKLSLQNVPFWEALEQLAKTSNHRLSISAQGSKIALLGGPNEKYGQEPVDLQGPFRFCARKTLGKIDLETGQSSTEVDIDVVWEPRFKAFYAEVPSKSLSAWDNEQKPLHVAGEGSGKLPVTGTAIEFTARLVGVPREAKRIGRLEGEIHFTGTTQMLQFSFAADATGNAATSQREGVTATLKQFEKKGRIWSALIEFEYPKGGPEFESFQSFLLDNQSWLVHRDGRRFLNQGLFELLGEHNGKYPVAYRFVENEKDGFVISNPKDWQIVVRTPGRISVVPVKFRLNNISLP